MKRTCRTFALFAFGVVLVVGSPVPSAGQSRISESELADLRSRYPDEALIWTYYKVSVEQRGRYTYKTRIDRRKVILDKSKVVNADFEFRLEREEKLKKIEIVVAPQKGPPVRLAKGQTEREKDLVSGDTYTLRYDNLDDGTIIYEHVEAELKLEIPRFFFELPIRHLAAVDTSIVEFTVSNDLTYRMTPVDASVEIFSEFETAKRNSKLTRFRASHVPAYVEEPFSPVESELADRIQFELLEVKGLGPGGKLYSAPESWEEVANSIQEYGSGADGRSGVVRDLAEQFAPEGASDSLKIALILGYTWGLRVVEGDAATKYSNIILYRKGNSYSITGLANALLNRVGIPSKVVIGHSSTTGRYNPLTISHRTFTVPAVQIVSGETPVYLFPLSTTAPFDLPATLLGQPALVIGDEGYEGIIELPSEYGPGNTLALHYDVTLDEQGNTVVREKREYTGLVASSIMDELKKLKRSELEGYVASTVGYDGADISLNRFEFGNLDNRAKPLTLDLEYTVGGLVSVTPDEVVFRTGGLFVPQTIDRVVLDPDRRVNPIAIYYTIELIQNVQIHVPADWRAQQTADAQQIESKFGRSTANHSWADSTYSFVRHLGLDAKVGTRDDYPELIRLLGSDQGLSLETVIFDRGTSEERNDQEGLDDESN